MATISDIFRCRLLIFVVDFNANFAEVCSWRHAVVNKSALIQLLAWHLVGAKPLAESMLTKMLGTIYHHQATVS